MKEPTELKTRFLAIYPEIMKRHNLKYDKDVASKISIDPNSFSQVLNKNRELTVKQVSKLVSELNVNPNYLLTGKKPYFVQQVEKSYDLEEVLEEYIKIKQTDEALIEVLISKIKKLEVEVAKLKKMVEGS